MKSIIPLFLTVLILVSPLIVGFNASPAKANNTIYTKADGAGAMRQATMTYGISRM